MPPLDEAYLSLTARQEISRLVERFGYAACLNCDRPTVKMFLDPGWGMMYVRCQACLVFYPYVAFHLSEV